MADVDHLDDEFECPTCGDDRQPVRHCSMKGCGQLKSPCGHAYPRLYLPSLYYRHTP